jgi:AraC family transcriptional regulator of adaptative response / DNA-3-methyladenine glycosylase II
MLMVVQNGRMSFTDLTDDERYDAVASRDRRFDGWFIVGVTSTGIYCRPSCPTPIRPKRENTAFFPTSAAAQRAGFRSCKRCRPDATPGSPAWDVRADLVGRAMRLIADGVVDREGVKGLAARLAVSERHLHRLLVETAGAGPIAIARAHRAQTARVLVETTDMRFADVAFAAGFSSIRQFNDTVKEVFARSPRELRARASSKQVAAPGEVVVRLALRGPIATDDLVGWLAHRSVPGIQYIETGDVVRTLRLPSGWGVARLSFADDHVRCALQLEHVADLAAAVERCRRLLDLDVDPLVIDDALSSDPLLAPLVAARPGLRSPGSVDGFETAVFAVLGQQISVKAACGLAARLVQRHGREIESQAGHRVFPAPGDLIEGDLTDLGLTRRTQGAIADLAEVCADTVIFDPGADREAARAELLAIKGIGPWTADYIALRALRDPDVLPTGDLVVRKGATAAGLPGNAAELAAYGRRWSPWRTYVTHHLWAHAAQPSTVESAASHQPTVSGVPS